MIVFSMEGIEALEEMIPLLKRHAHEVNWTDRPISPNKDVYEAMLNAGAYALFTARSNGRLFGYAGFFVNRHPHYENFTQAVSDVIYVSPEKRRGIGARLIEFAEANLKVDAILYYVTTQKDYSFTLTERGYKLIEHTYAKRLAK